MSFIKGKKLHEQKIREKEKKKGVKIVVEQKWKQASM